MRKFSVLALSATLMNACMHTNKYNACALGVSWEGGRAIPESQIWDGSIVLLYGRSIIRALDYPPYVPLPPKVADNRACTVIV